MKKWIILLVPLAMVLMSLYGSGQAHSYTFGRSAAMGGNAILDSLNNAARTVTQTWTFSGATTSLVIEDGKMTTPDSVRSICYVECEWFGFSEGSNNTTRFWVTNGVNDYGFVDLTMPAMLHGGIVVIDSILLYMDCMGGGTDDSVRAYIQKWDYANNDISEIDSVWCTGDNWAQYNIISSDITINLAYFYGIYLKCINDGASDVSVNSCVRIVYHLE